jgi:Domain of unknown function (DUF4149)
MAHLIALAATALLLGGMVFFSTIVAPLVFMRLPPEHAGRFIRAIFPVYYLYGLACAVMGALAAAWFDLPVAVSLAVFALVSLWLRLGLMPRINRLSDAVHCGEATAKRAFDRAHRLSVLVNAGQILLAGWCLARLG